MLVGSFILFYMIPIKVKYELGFLIELQKIDLIMKMGL